MVQNEINTTKQPEKGYEALIKPIQDVIAKDWKVRLCNYLDIYIEHIHEPGTVFINFTEAALLVQNTSTYYCRRVDLMYNWVRQFCFSLAEKFLEATAEEGEVSQEKSNPNEGKTNQKKGKKNKNQLQSEEFEALPLMHTGSKTVNYKIDKLDPSLIRQVVLNSCMKTQTKPATCIPVQQSLTEEMGFKDEFRLHWKMAEDGQLHEDFRYDLSQGGIAAEVMANEALQGDCLLRSNDDSDGDHDYDDAQMDAVDNNDMDIEAVPPANPELSSSIQLNTDMPEHRASETLGLMPDNQPEEVSEVIEKLPKKPEENFFTIIPFASLIMHRKFKKRQVFKLPKELIEEVSESRKKQKKNGKTDKDGKIEQSDCNYHLSFSELLGGKSEDMIQHKLGKRRSASLSKRKKRIQAQQPENNNLENAADLNDVMDDDDHDFDDIVDEANDLVGETEGGFDDEYNGNFDDAYEASAQLYGEIMRTKNDPLSIAKRVASWHNMIQPVLEKAEARSVFSVNEYGTRILEKFNEPGEIRQFSDLVAGQPKEEICRYFLSTLMLANTYNLELQKTDDGELAKDCLQMKLLSKVRHHEELDANVGATTANGPVL